MLNDEAVGRVLLASLHQAIGEVLPARLEFYEQWLQPPDHPDESLRIAPFEAMLNALQHEDDSENVIARAGQYAAIRSYERLGALRRACLRILPRRIRARKAVGLVVEILPTFVPEARIDVTRRGSTTFIGIDGSPFCTPTGRTSRPSCHFYSNVVITFVQLFKLSPSVRVSRCRVSGTPGCLLTVLPYQPRGGAGIETVVPGLTDDVMVPDLPAADLPLAPNEPALEVPVVSEAPAALDVAEKPDVPAESEPEHPPIDRKATATRWDSLFRRAEDPEGPWHRL